MRASEKSGHAPSWRSVFGIPIIIGIAAMAGLMAALLFGETGRYVSWIAVGSPIMLVAWLMLRRNSRSF